MSVLRQFKAIKGFTLIELVIVIVVLSILAATALPKFIDINSDATSNVMKKIAGDIQTAVTFVEAKRQIDASTTSVDYAGVNIPLKGGYPEGSLPTLNSILEIKTPSRYTRYWNSSQLCDFNDFCMVGRLTPSQGPGIPGHNAGMATYIWPKGYSLDGCFSYYVNPETGEEPLVGAVTDKC